LQYNRPCQFFGVCGLHSLDQYKEIPEDTIEYQFIYNMDDLIQDHLKRIVQQDTQLMTML